MAMWKITSGRGSRLTDQFLDRNCVAIGWREVGDYTASASRDDLIVRFANAYPDKTSKQVSVIANQAWRFLRAVEIGDDVIVYDPPNRKYAIGKISSAPTYRPDAISVLPVMRSVEWKGFVNRDDLSQKTKNSLGAIMALFKVPDECHLEILGGPDPAGANNELVDLLEAEDQPSKLDSFDGLAELALERIKDRLTNLTWDEMQEMVAALLRALGYRTQVSPAGPDRGKDIVASRDGFGFEPPRIVVEVKHRPKQPMGAPEIRAFLGGRHAEDRGLYVSTGGFTREAHFEAERASTVTHLMTLDDLASSIVENYDSLDARGRILLPLQKLYWPV